MNNSNYVPAIFARRQRSSMREWRAICRKLTTTEDPSAAVQSIRMIDYRSTSCKLVISKPFWLSEDNIYLIDMYSTFSDECRKWASEHKTLNGGVDTADVRGVMWFRKLYDVNIILSRHYWWLLTVLGSSLLFPNIEGVESQRVFATKQLLMKVLDRWDDLIEDSDRFRPTSLQPEGWRSWGFPVAALAARGGVELGLDPATATRNGLRRSLELSVGSSTV